ncbi:3-isopropylmalate dehydrogenase [Agaricicola taiwanensis]|uniref:3-isopropylmalate dehydrogenase n=1 Tax=Agaricicola taiwanensis TaxID=591372 RepID=A0A8J2VIU4_9RHOB|nr:isocitrate/isopropylmalate dehydrogenase family protein [Agaricicola taiwanensis]GGE27619.1 3-isopropylmalate dehydrogenase [Agaricicola taiwanensis]
MDIIILEGDGIGPEIVAATRLCLDALNKRHELGAVIRDEDIGFKSLKVRGTTLADEVVEEARKADGIILGPVSTADYPPRDKGGINPSAGLRLGLDLYANMRPSYVRPGVPSLVPAMDLLIARENTEGFYADRNMVGGTSSELMPTPDVALAMRKITRHNSERIARAGFQAAMTRRKKVTIVHKGNVMKKTDGLFIEACRDVGKDFPEVAVNDVIVDAMTSHLVRDASRYDVIVTTNMFGDILSNLASELAGGLGLAESLNHGDHNGMAQASHGSAPDIAGRNIANPTSLILSMAMLLDWLATRHGRQNYREAADELRAAVQLRLADPASRTPDLGGTGSTESFARDVVETIQSGRAKAA